MKFLDKFARMLQDLGQPHGFEPVEYETCNACGNCTMIVQLKTCETCGWRKK